MMLNLIENGYTYCWRRDYYGSFSMSKYRSIHCNRNFFRRSGVHEDQIDKLDGFSKTHLLN